MIISFSDIIPQVFSNHIDLKSGKNQGGKQ
jgi:hypothetical protein